MFKAFVVDDEPSVIEGMKLMIPWSDLDFEFCGESSNGRDALQKFGRIRPHLVITDIRMPLVNGLELIDEARKLKLDTEFVILSGYSDFSYAREAMRHQVFHYLLKPLDKDEIVSVLKRIKSKLNTKFLADYGFTSEDVETFKASASLSQGLENGAKEAASKDEGPWWKSIRDSYDEELNTALKLMNEKDARKLIDELFHFFKDRQISLYDAGIMVNSCVYHILRIAYERNIKLNTLLPVERGEDLSFGKLRRYITDILTQTIELMLEDRRKNARSCLYEVKEYIEKHFTAEISVASLADRVYLEAGYLGDAFSRQFGWSINEYQHRLRIQKAVELISSTDMKLSDIAAEVGYNNYNNFFTHFGRITRKKPNQYHRS